MTTETMSNKAIEELDQTLGFGPKAGKSGDGFEPAAVVPEVWYWCRLARIGKPFTRPNPRNPEKTITKAPFEFFILGEANKQNALVETDYYGLILTSFINVEGWGDKSTMMPLCSALLGKDAGEVVNEIGRMIAPSDIIGQECWVRVGNSASDTGEVKSWPSEYKAKLPQIQFSVGKGAAKPAVTPIGIQAQQSAVANKPATFGKGGGMAPAPKPELKLESVNFDDDEVGPDGKPLPF